MIAYPLKVLLRGCITAGLAWLLYRSAVGHWIPTTELGLIAVIVLCFPVATLVAWLEILWPAIRHQLREKR